MSSRCMLGKLPRLHTLWLHTLTPPVSQSGGAIRVEHKTDDKLTVYLAF